jgi:hypothetical protein
LPHLVGRLAPHTLVRERAPAHERRQALDIVERRSSDLHGRTPFEKSVYALRREAAEAPE